MQDSVGHSKEDLTLKCFKRSEPGAMFQAPERQVCTKWLTSGDSGTHGCVHPAFGK